MGYRTVVILNNDLAREWEVDPELGKRIGWAMTHRMPMEFKGGVVVECVHADVQTLAVVDSFQFTPLTWMNWHQGQDTEQRNLQLLKNAADKLGYRLVRKSK